MKNCLTILLIGFWCLTGTAQNQFSKEFDIISRSGFDSPGKFIKSADQGYAFVVTGTSNGLQVVKTDSLANVEWSTELSGNYYFGSILEKSTGGYWIFTSKLDTNFSYFQTLFSLDSLGNMEWSNSYTDPNQWGAAAEVIELNNSLLLIGDIYDTITNKKHFAVTKSDLNGNVLWQKRYGDTMYIEARDALKLNDNEILLTGIDWWWNTANLLKIDSSGNIIWHKNYVDTAYYDLEPLVIDTCANGDILMAGRRSYATWDIMAMRLDASGNFIWGSQYIDNWSDDEAYGIHENNDGSIILTTEPESFSGNSSQTALLKTDSLGNMQWLRLILPEEQSFPFGSLKNYDDGITILGIRGAWGIDTGKVYMMRTSSTFETTCNQLDVTVIEEDFNVVTLDHTQVSTFTFYQPNIVVQSPYAITSNYYCSGVGISEQIMQSESLFHPNPTEGAIFFNEVFDEIIVTNNLGQIERYFKNTNTIDLSALGSGTYFIEIRDGSSRLINRVILK